MHIRSINKSREIIGDALVEHRVLALHIEMGIGTAVASFLNMIGIQLSTIKETSLNYLRVVWVGLLMRDGSTNMDSINCLYTMSLSPSKLSNDISLLIFHFLMSSSSSASCLHLCLTPSPAHDNEAI